MKRMKLVCSADPSHSTFSVNVAVMQAWEVDEHGDFHSVLADLGAIEEPGLNHEYICAECDAEAEITMTGKDPKRTAEKEVQSAKAPKAKSFSSRKLGFYAAVSLIVLVARWQKVKHPLHYAYFAPWRTGVGEIWHLGLATPGGIGSEGKEGAGLWTPTDVGLNFATKGLAIPSTAIVVNGKTIRLEGETKSIKRCFIRKNKDLYEPAMEALKVGDTSLIPWLKKMAKGRLNLPTDWNDETKWGVNREETQDQG